MGRKRKVPVADEEKENEDESTSTANSSSLLHGPMYTIMSNVQLNETFHKRYVKEMKLLYTKMDHDAFIFTLIKMIKSAMEADEGNEYAHTTLLFCAKFVSSYEGEETHPLLMDTCKWLLTTISNNPHIRFRLCEFVNMILNALSQEAALDDAICDHIMEYMLDRLRDVSASVRVQSTLAMQRLQVPDNPDDPVLRAYQFHLCSDPSPRVRQAIITCMGRNYHTLPYILDRLWDIDEKVRRHTYLHMSSYPVRSYKVAQRLMLLEQGLNDRSDTVRKVAITIMLKQWIESYQKDLIALISALKLDSNESEIDRFKKITKQALKEICRIQDKEDLLSCLPIEEDGEYHRCVPHDKLTIEIALYWQCLTDHLQSEMAEEFDLVVPELSTFCSYVEKFCENQKPEMDKFEQMEFQYMLLSLMEILYTFDLGDEIGRGNLQKFLSHLLKNFTLDEKVIEMTVRCAENLITDQNTRLQFFAEIIRGICDLNPKLNDVVYYCNLINELLANSSDGDLNLKLSSLKVKLMDLEEQETNYLQSKDYVRAHEIAGEKSAAIEKHMHLMDNRAAAVNKTKAAKNQSVLKSLQIIFYMVVSPKVSSLNPSICKLYNDFICRHIASSQITIRDWALKCGTAYSMLYETLAKDVFAELYSQFFKSHNIRLWETAIQCIFELLDRYGIDNFVEQEHQIKSKKSGRQLYNTLEFLDVDEESRVSVADQGVGVIYMMSYFLETCHDVCILRAITKGFCCLVLRGFLKTSGIIEKLLLRYFNPTTDPEINQMLGIFLEKLIARKQHALLQPCLLPTISSVLGAPYDSPLRDIRPETIARFIIDATRLEPCADSGSMHNKLALTFLQEMLANVSNKELCKLLAKELLTLELNVAQYDKLKQEMKEMIDKLLKSEFDPKTIKNIIDFKDMLNGVYNPPRNSAKENESEDESKSDDETNTVIDKEPRICGIISEETIEEEVSAPEIAPTSVPASSPAIVPTPAPVIAPTSVPAPISESMPTPIPAAVIAPVSAASEEGAESETHTESEIQATETASPNKTISPSAHTPTTYGRDNIVSHRFLRKSLNLSRSQSDPEIGDGPSRPNKIRIEARIDSDKKSTQPPDQQKLIPTNAAARRNLRYARKNGNAIETSPKKNNHMGSRKEKRTIAEPEEIRSNPHQPKSLLYQQSSETHSQSLKRNPSSVVQSKPVLTSKMPVRINTRYATRFGEASKTIAIPKQLAAPLSQSSSSEYSSSDELNSSDVIPPSPEVDTMSRLNATRLRRGAIGGVAVRPKSPLLTRSSSMRALRLAARTKNITIAAASEGKVKAHTPIKAKLANPSNTTPLRNGRKRVLQATSSRNETNRISPLRKQQRTEQPRKRTSQVGEARKDGSPLTNESSLTLMHSSGTVRENGSPSSTKENEVAAGNKASSPVPLIRKDSSSAITVESHLSEELLGYSSAAPSPTPCSTPVPKSNGKSSAATSQENVFGKNTASNPVATRSSARKLLQSQMMVTRKRRLSWDNSNSDGSPRTSTTAFSVQQGKGKVPSRIPVRTAKSKVAIRIIVTSENENATSSSSSSCGIVGGKASKLPRRRKSLTTKMTRISLSVNPTKPLPMCIACPNHASTSSLEPKVAPTKKATVSNSRIAHRRNR